MGKSKLIIYENELYLFEKLTISSVGKMLDGYEFDITVGMQTPEYATVFKGAWFHMEVPALVKIMESFSKEIRDPFWKLFYEISESATEDEEWEIYPKLLKETLGTFPVIDTLSIVASVDFVDLDLNDNPEVIEFNINDPDDFIQPLSANKRPPPGNRDLTWVANDICILAQKTGHDFTKIWDFLNKLRDPKFLKAPENKSLIPDMIDVVHQRLIRWDLKEAQELDHEMLKFI